jgi:hypothetical protein
MEREEAHRNKWVLGLTTFLTAVIFVSFAFYKGFLSFGNFSSSKNQVASVVSAEKAPSPIENTKTTFSAAFSEISKQFNNFKESMSSVLVPFVTGIDVYNRQTP